MSRCTSYLEKELAIYARPWFKWYWLVLLFFIVSNPATLVRYRADDFFDCHPESKGASHGAGLDILLDGDVKTEHTTITCFLW